MKILIAIVLTAAATGTAAFFVLGPGGAEKVEEEGTPVRIETVERGNLIEFFSAPGIVEPKTRVMISARVSARISELPFEEGDTVTKGNAGSSGQPIPPSLLVRLDSTDLEAALKSAQARRKAQVASIEVEKARIASQQSGLKALDIQLSQAIRDLKRQEGLLKTKDVSESVVEDARSNVDELKAQLESSQQSLEAAKKNLVVLQHNLEVADAEIAKAEDNLSYTTIMSPIDGVVTQLNAEVGELAVTGTMNNPGTMILEVGDLSKMLLVAQVDEADIGKVKLGQRSRVRIQAYPDREFEGKVEQIALTATTDQSKYFKVEILLNTEGERIYTGLTADVDVETQSHTDVLKVPSQAVLGAEVDNLPTEIRDDNPLVDEAKTIIPVVYRFIEDKAVVTPVKIGASDATHTVIEEGLSETDRIITRPYKVLESLSHDQKVMDEKEKKKKDEEKKKEGDKKDEEEEGDDKASKSSS